MPESTKDKYDIGDVLAVKLDEMIEGLEKDHPEYKIQLDHLRISMPFRLMEVFHEHVIRKISLIEKPFDVDQCNYRGIKIVPTYNNLITLFHVHVVELPEFGLRQMKIP